MHFCAKYLFAWMSASRQNGNAWVTAILLLLGFVAFESAKYLLFITLLLLAVEASSGGVVLVLSHGEFALLQLANHLLQAVSAALIPCSLLTFALAYFPYN
jgi:hypothetical protein